MYPGLFFKSKTLSQQKLKAIVELSAKRLEIATTVIPVEVTTPASCVLVLFLDDYARLKAPLLQLDLEDVALTSSPFEMTNYGLI